MYRKAVKVMLSERERNYPVRKEIIFKLIENIAPSHLFNKDLFDFENYTIRDDKCFDKVDDLVPYEIALFFL
tara:strand:- start:1267 stop:1482 length:216 start_codon:yes stop_codon:yes gene_type:complete